MSAGGKERFAASLAMYDWEEVRWATDAFWMDLAENCRRRGIEAPAEFERDRAHLQLCRDPSLVFGQVCGYHYATELKGVVELVATPRYAARGCTGMDYSSFLLVHQDSSHASIRDLRGRVAIVNSTASQSGYSAFRAAIAPVAQGKRFFERVLISGGHRASILAVAERRADVCSTDAVCVALAERHDTDVFSRLRVLAHTPSVPAMPFVCAAGLANRLLPAIREALFDVLADPKGDSVRRALFLDGAGVLSEDDYERVKALEQRSIDLGYPLLA
jgi:ABC-type phosphate/phosphonate transport system substrate-binding protein